MLRYKKHIRYLIKYFSLFFQNIFKFFFEYFISSSDAVYCHYKYGSYQSSKKYN